EIGGLGKLLYFLVQQPAPFVPVVQIEDMVDHMVPVQAQAQPVDEPLVEAIVVRGEMGIDLAALQGLSKTEFTVQGQHIKMVVTNGDSLSVQLDIRIKPRIEAVEKGMGMLQDFPLVHGRKEEFFTVVDKGNGIAHCR